jgi:hypothetical protein
MAKSRSRLLHSTRSAEPPTSDETAVANDRSTLFNQLALLFVVLTPLALIVYLVIFLFPQLPINPLPPIKAGQVAIAGPTRTPVETSRPTRTPHPTNTPTPTATPAATDTPTVIVIVTVKPGSTRTRVPTATPIGPRTAVPTRSVFNYTAELIYQHHQLYGSSWAGMAGLVFDANLKHQQNIDVHAWGDAPLGVNGQESLSGTYPQYGPSGWEFQVADKPVFGTWHVQLVDDQGTPLSNVVDVVMQGDSRANLAYIIFQQNH